MHKRNCCDPIAGRLCVAIAEAALGALGSAFDATTPERSATPTRSRPFCRPGLDWSERRRHIAGTLGALICSHGLEQRWLLRRAGGRAFDITAPDESALRGWLGGALWQRVMAGDREAVR